MILSDISENVIDAEAVKLLQELKKKTSTMVDASRSGSYDVKGKLVGLTPTAPDQVIAFLIILLFISI